MIYEYEGINMVIRGVADALATYLSTDIADVRDQDYDFDWKLIEKDFMGWDIYCYTPK